MPTPCLRRRLESSAAADRQALRAARLNGCTPVLIGLQLMALGQTLPCQRRSAGPTAANHHPAGYFRVRDRIAGPLAGLSCEHHALRECRLMAIGGDPQRLKSRRVDRAGIGGGQADTGS